jgi:hypothetical protein
MATGTWLENFANLTSGDDIYLVPGFGYTVGVANGATTWYYEDGKGNASVVFGVPFTFPNGRGPYARSPRDTQFVRVFCVSGSITIIKTPI